jgi:hypothetical protein
MKKIAILLGILLMLTVSSFAFAFASNYMACTYSYFDQGVVSGIPYMSGGVGEQERLCLAPMEKDYNLKMVFSLNSKQYLANETVTIHDMQGREVFLGRVDGPWLFVRLPSGDCKVTVSSEDRKSETRHVKAGKAMHVEYFTWKS